MKLLTEHEVKSAIKCQALERTLARTLEVGDIVSCGDIYGVVGEILADKLFLWHNTGHCGGVHKNPIKETNGEYKNSWCVDMAEHVTAIRLRNIKPMDKKRYLEIIKANLI